MFHHTLRYAAGALAVLLSATGAFCQSDSLALSSATVPPGGTASLALSLTASAGSQPAGMEWTISVFDFRCDCNYGLCGRRVDGGW